MSKKYGLPFEWSTLNKFCKQVFSELNECFSIFVFKNGVCLLCLWCRSWRVGFFASDEEESEFERFDLDEMPLRFFAHGDREQESDIKEDANMSLLNDNYKKIAGANHLRKNYFGLKLWLLRLKFPSISEVVMSEISLQTRGRLTSLSCFLPNVCIVWLSAKPPVMLGRNNGVLARNCSGESWQSKSFAHGLVYILQRK